MTGPTHSQKKRKDKSLSCWRRKWNMLNNCHNITKKICPFFLHLTYSCGQLVPFEMMKSFSNICPSAKKKPSTCHFLCYFRTLSFLSRCQLSHKPFLTYFDGGRKNLFFILFLISSFFFKGTDSRIGE